MNFRIILLFAVLTAAFFTHAENLLKNPDFQKNKDNIITAWSRTPGMKQDTGYKGKNSVVAEIMAQEKSPFARAVISQRINNVQPGKYIFSCYLKTDMPLNRILLVGWTPLAGKSVYQWRPLESNEHPEPGVWKKVMAEFTMPEKSDTPHMSVAIEVRNLKPEGKIWLDSPCLTFVKE